MVDVLLDHGVVVFPVNPKALDRARDRFRQSGAKRVIRLTLGRTVRILGRASLGAIVEAVRRLGLDVRAGIHTGECEVIGDKLDGIAVHIGARVASLAAPGDVLVSSTVKDLVAGSGLRFEDRGVHILKGIPGEWRLYAVAG